MSANHNIVADLPVQAQAQIFSKEISTIASEGSIWAQNTGEVLNVLGTKQVPDNIICTEEKAFDGSSYKVNTPFLGRHAEAPLFGLQDFEAIRPEREARYCSLYYQTEATVLPMSNRYSLDGRLETEFYKLVNEQKKSVASWMKDLTDYNVKRSVVEGYSEAVTDTNAWAGTGLESEKPSVRFHPNVFINDNGAAAIEPTWHATNATYVSNIVTAAAATTTADFFGSHALDQLVERVSMLKPIGGNGIMGAQHLVTLTPQQATQLSSEDGIFFKRFEGGAIDASKNPNITGVLGVYRGILFVVDPKAAVLDLATETVKYSKPQTQGAFGLTSRVTRVTKDTGAVGTMEIAMAFGGDAIRVLKAGNMEIRNKSFNYGTLEGMLAIRMLGYNRFEALKAATKPVNQSSFLFLTPSTSVRG